MFIDTATIRVRSGSGGHGAVSFRREKFVPKGGPDGGDGGNGGDVKVHAESNLSTLMDLRYKREYTARNGQNGAGGNKDGKFGESVTVSVPVGTMIYDEETGELLADLATEGEVAVVARGGKGGRGNAVFATPSHRSPRRFEEGTSGEERRIRLELKLLADVGLVGFPNAGKSTLISRISAAKPKVAEYPFTTLIPNLGIVQVEPGRSFVVADIPGLIEGASEGKGLGHDFLRHVERSGILCFLINGLGLTPEEDFATLLTELGKYNVGMLWKPRLVCITKIDAMSQEQIDTLRDLTVDGKPAMLISSVSGTGLEELIHALENALVRTRELQ